MDNKLFVFLIAATGVIGLAGVAKFWYSRYYKRLSISEGNKSWSVFVAGQFLGFTLIYQNSMQNIIMMKIIIEDSAENHLIELVEYLGLFLIIIIVVYTVLSAFSNIFIRVLVPLEKGIFTSIKDDNIAPVIVAATLLFCSSWICGSLLDDIFQELLPERDTPKWF